MILPSNSGKRKTLVEAVVDMVTVDWADIVGGADTARGSSGPRWNVSDWRGDVNSGSSWWFVFGRAVVKSCGRAVLWSCSRVVWNVRSAREIVGAWSCGVLY
jgi:hypothetical protein